MAALRFLWRRKDQKVQALAQAMLKAERAGPIWCDSSPMRQANSVWFAVETHEN